MKITIDSIEIKEEHVDMVINVRGLIKDQFDYHVGREIKQMALKAVTEKLTEQYLAQYTHEIMAGIDQQQILNMIVLNSASRVSGRD